MRLMVTFNSQLTILSYKLGALHYIIRMLIPHTMTSLPLVTTANQAHRVISDCSAAAQDHVEAVVVSRNMIMGDCTFGV